MMFGDLEFFEDFRRLDGFSSRKAKLVFAYLLLSRGRLFERPYLAAQFWVDQTETRARKSLNTEIWRLSSSLKNQGLDPDRYLTRNADVVGVPEGAECWTDVGCFEAAVRSSQEYDPGSCPDDVRKSLNEAVALYRGKLLEGVFDDWCLVRREALIAQQGQALEYLMRIHMQDKDWQVALAYGQKMLALDPLMEHVHRDLMRCHYLMGNRPAAIRQYATCQRLLRTELGVSPMEETEQVYQAMLVRKPSPQTQLYKRRASGNTPLRNVDLALANLHTAAGWLEEASDQLKTKQPKN